MPEALEVEQDTERGDRDGYPSESGEFQEDE